MIVAPLWRNTGVGAAQVAALGDAPGVAWHIWNGDDPAIFRLSASDDGALMELIDTIAPDITLCRTADFDTARRLPGIVRFIMEAGAAPLPTASDWIVLQDTPFHSGAMPALESEARARLDDLFAPVWSQLVVRHGIHDAAQAAAFRGAEGLPADARVLALPLEYTHEENLFRRFSSFGDNAALVRDVAARLPGGWVLAVSNHPLNVLHVDNSALHAAVAELGSKVRLIRDQGSGGGATMALAAHCDGMLIEQSKSFVAGAFHRVPLHRTSPFATAAWLNADTSLDSFLQRIDAGTAVAPDPAGLRTWLGYHLVNDVIDPDHPDLDADELINRVVRPQDETRWETGMARFERNRPDGVRRDEGRTAEGERQLQLLRRAMGRR